MAVQLNPFMWGSKGEKLTPEQVARRQELAALALSKVGDTSPVGHWTQGAGRVVNAITGKIQERRADASEAAGMASADAYVQNNPVLAALFGGGAPAAPPMSVTASSSGAPAPVGVAAPEPIAVTPIDPNSPDAIGNDVMSALGKATVAGGHDHQDHAGQSHADWLKYSNTGATRNDPLAPELVNAMSFVGDMGITMDVVSGGQEAAGQGGSRTGSTRHDHGNAADVDFYKDGRKLDWNNPADLPVLQEIVVKAKSNGVTGIGAGDDYMGAGRFHVGFGNPGVWGAGGSGANAPEWLRTAYNGAPAGASPAVSVSTSGGGGGAPMAAPSGQSVTAALAAAMSDPWVAKKYGPVIESLMGQQMRRDDMAYQQQLAQSDPMYQAELAALTTPEAPKPIEVGGVLLDPVTLEPLFDSRTAGGAGQPASVQEYEYYKAQTEEAGGKPKTFDEWQNPAAVPDAGAVFTNASDLRKEWNGNASVKAFGTQSPAYGRLVASAKDPSAAGDLSLIFNYMKILDPGSTVREGEFATAQEAGGVGERVIATYNGLLNGQRLTPAQRADFLDRGKRLYEDAETQYQGLYDQFAGIATRNGLPVDDALIDYRYVPSSEPEPTAYADAPAIGEIVEDHEYLGGDPANPASWRKVQ